MGGKQHDQGRPSPLLGELARLLGAAGSGEATLAAALPLLAAIGRCSDGALYVAAGPQGWRRLAAHGDGSLFPARLPADGLATAGDSPALPRHLDPALPPDADLLAALAAAGRPRALVVPFPAQGRLPGLCLLADRGERPLGRRRAAALAQAGALLGLRLVADDLEARVGELDLRFTDLSLSSADHIWELDVRGRYSYNSKGSALLLGYRPSEMHGRRPLDFVHPEDRRRLRSAIAQARASRQPLGELVHRAIAADGSEVYVESRAFPILDAEGRLRGYRGVDRNITDWFQAKRVMEETLIGTCEALGRMVELRDPYTKGHSVRVAALAVLLGKRLGRAGYELQGLQLMGLLHDIGKVGIPTEILSKPSRLSPEELELMRQHPQMGYDILKDISFPWPVAAVVLQHHERLDGSGYPQGLTGPELMWQVRLMAVADLLEAMATDRPYRPGLGLDVALRELGQQRGLLYDAEIVDAALAAAAAGELASLLDRPALPAAGEGAAFGLAAVHLLEAEFEPSPSA